MSIFSLERVWRLNDGERTYRVAAKVWQEPPTTALLVTVDDVPHVDGKAWVMDLSEIWQTYGIELGPRTVALRAFKKGFHGHCTDFELIADGQVLPESEHRLVQAAPSTPPPNAAAAPVAAATAPPAGQTTVREVPTVPALPTTCPHCRAPLLAAETKWTGPLAAECPYCKAGIAAEWRRVAPDQ